MTYDISAETLRMHEHIPDVEVEQDIAETQDEINNLEFEYQGFDNLWHANQGTAHGKMYAFKRDNRRIQIDERKRFIDKLQSLLAARILARSKP